MASPKALPASLRFGLASVERLLPFASVWDLTPSAPDFGLGETEGE